MDMSKINPMRLITWLQPGGLTTPKFPGIALDRKSISFLGVELPKGQGGKHTPALTPFRQYATSEYELALMQKIALAWELKDPLLIETNHVTRWAKTVDLMCAYLNREVHYLNCSGVTEELLFGKEQSGLIGGEKRVDGIAIRAMRTGAVLVLDNVQARSGEIDAPLMRLLEACAEKTQHIKLPGKDGQSVRIHPDFHLVCLKEKEVSGEEKSKSGVLPSDLMSSFIYLRELDILPEEHSPNDNGSEVEDTNSIHLEAEFLYPKKRGGTPVFAGSIPGAEWLKDKFESCLISANELMNRGRLGVHPQTFLFDVAREGGRFHRLITQWDWKDINYAAKRAIEYLVLNRFGRECDRQVLRELFSDVHCEVRDGKDL